MAFLTPPPPSNSPFSSTPPPPQTSHPPIPLRKQRNIPAALSLPKLPSRTVYFSRLEVIERRLLPSSVVDNSFAHLLHKRVTRLQIQTALKKCNSWFAERGYACSRLVIIQYPGWFGHTLVLYSIEPKLAALRLILVDKEGKDVNDGTEVVTKKKTILRVLGLKLGEVFEWKPDGFGALMALGVFEYADAEVNPVTDEAVELTLKIRERPSCRVEPGAGMTSDGRFYGDVSVVDNNFMGHAQRLQLEWQKHVDMSRISGGFMFEDMRIGAKLPVSFKLRAYRDSNAAREIPTGTISHPISALASPDQHTRRDRSTEPSLRYEKDRDGVMVEVAYRPGKNNFLFTATPMLEFVRPNVGARGVGERVLQSVLQFGAMHITRLPLDTPRFGHSVNLEHSVGTILFEPNGEQFRKTVLRISQYLGVGEKASIAIGTTLGFGSENLPFHEQKSLGGVSNVRGYGYGELGRYKSYGVGRVELRVPLTKVPEPREMSGQGPEVQNKIKQTDKTLENPESEVSSPKNGNLFSPKMFDTLPPLVGVLFGDIAASSGTGPEPIGASYGLGLRVGGIIAVDWTRTAEGKQSRVHFGLIDRSL